MALEYILIQCYSCSMFQVKQKTKVNSFTCVICHEKQSIMRIYGISYQAKDLRDLVKKYNLEQGQKRERSANDEEEEGHEFTFDDDTNQQNMIQQPLQQSTSDWKQYFDDNDQDEENDLINKYYNESTHNNDNIEVTTDISTLGNQKKRARTYSSRGRGGKSVGDREDTLKKSRQHNDQQITTSKCGSTVANRNTGKTSQQPSQSSSLSTAPSSLAFQSNQSPNLTANNKPMLDLQLKPTNQNKMDSLSSKASSSSLSSSLLSSSQSSSLLDSKGVKSHSKGQINQLPINSVDPYLKVSNNSTVFSQRISATTTTKDSSSSASHNNETTLTPSTKSKAVWNQFFDDEDDHKTSFNPYGDSTTETTDNQENDQFEFVFSRD
ncbi:hypothetical protein SAMD00019534_007830, partial [Acytostelium subglobosum LB1]|uniref:hypothetical protein n=1 Tax=Acytostelium subglobosum LB1 TaxID=1410327 RepID=UPI000644E7BC